MKKPGQMFLVLIAFSAIAIMLSLSFQAQPVKVTGTWKMTVETNVGSGTPEFVLKQEMDTLITGTYKGSFGAFPVKGTIRANKISLKFSTPEIVIEYTGTVDGNNMKGKVVLGTAGEGTFTGTRISN